MRPVDLSVQAAALLCGTGTHAGGCPQLLVHHHAGGSRTCILLQSMVRSEGKRRHHRGVVEHSVVWVQNDIGSQTSSSQTRQYGRQHHAHGRSVAGRGERGSLHSVVAKFTLNIVSHYVHRHILPEIVSGDLHETVIRTTPGSRGRAGVPGHDHTLRSRKKILRAMSHRNILVESGRGGDSHDFRPGPQAEFFEHFFCGVPGGSRCV